MMIIVKNDLVTFKVIAVGLFQNALNLKVLTQYLKIIKNLLQKIFLAIFIHYKLSFAKCSLCTCKFIYSGEFLKV